MFTDDPPKEWCPHCSAAWLEVDDCFPDVVVWRCPGCFMRYTPRMIILEREGLLARYLIQPKKVVFWTTGRIIKYAFVVFVLTLLLLILL